MTETQTEPQEPTEVPDVPQPEPSEPVQPSEPTETPVPEEEPAAPQEPAQEPAAAPEGEVEFRSEKELEKGRKQIEKLRETNANRLAAIMGDEATFLIPCPVCGDEIPGFVFPPDVAPMDAEKVGAVSAYIGLPDLSQLEDARDATQCPDCKGRGEVKTHSLVPGQTTKMCSLCVGKGWTGTGTFVHPESTAVNGQTTEPPAFVPPVETALPPEAEALRRQGFLVIPPTQPVTV